jgi:hypothetical protein
VNKAVPLRFVKVCGELDPPGSMFAASVVPDGVPSVRQSSSIRAAPHVDGAFVAFPHPG